jgi:hypothetical protein
MSPISVARVALLHVDAPPAHPLQQADSDEGARV